MTTQPQENWNGDLAPFKHGEEGTHSVCNKHNIGGKSVCCICHRKDCAAQPAPQYDFGERVLNAVVFNHLEDFDEKREATHWKLNLQKLKSFVFLEIQKARRQEQKATIKLLEEIRQWNEPQSGAGEGLGALAGAGMYMQYDADSKKHSEQIFDIIQKIKEM